MYIHVFLTPPSLPPLSLTLPQSSLSVSLSYWPVGLEYKSALPQLLARVLFPPFHFISAISVPEVQRPLQRIEALLNKNRKAVKLERGANVKIKMQEIEPELSLDLFDHIDDLLDFPNEDMDGKLGDGMQIDWPTDDLFGVTNCTFTGHVEGGFDHQPGDFPLPCEDIAELEWLSNFVEDSFSGGSAAAATTAAVEDHNSSSHIVNDTTQFRTSSSVSVLESSSCSGKALSSGSNDALLSVPGKARSKRPRPAAFSPRVPTTTNNNSDDDDSSNNNLISPSSSASNPSSSDLSSQLQFQFEFEADSFAESKPPSRKVPKSVGGQRNRKAVLEQGNVAVRKCLHCGIQKTPQWRMGPMGPKTLCNACGVRYKSGRLFPEYRPAASPTFVASKHSNSHKKVMDMRTKKSTAGEERLVEKQQHELLFLRDTMVGYM